MRPKFLILIDVVLIVLATVLALVLRSNFDVSAEQMAAFLPYLAVTSLTSASKATSRRMARAGLAFFAMRTSFVLSCK